MSDENKEPDLPVEMTFKISDENKEPSPMRAFPDPLQFIANMQSLQLEQLKRLARATERIADATEYATHNK